MVGGEELQLTRENTTVVLHTTEQYQDMDHLFIRRLGTFGIRMFAIDTWKEYLVERGYDVLLKEYPDDLTVAVWMNLQKQHMDRELGGAGGELDD